MHTRFSTSHSCCDFLGFFSNFFDFFRFLWIFLPFSLTEFNGRQIKINEQNLTDRMASVSGHLYGAQPPCSPEPQTGPTLRTERETAPFPPAIRLLRGYKPAGQGQVHPNACRFEKPRIKWFRSLAWAVDEQKRPCGALSRTSRPRSAGFCIGIRIGDSVHSISE